MTPEKSFLKDLTDYFTEVEFSDTDLSRVEVMLSDYRDKIGMEKLIVFRDKVVEKVVYRKIPKNREAATPEKLYSLAKIICKDTGVRYVNFINNRLRRATAEVKIARGKFCLSALSQFEINQNFLADYFSVDHSTIVFYINGKKSKRKTAA